ncbi:MAG: hypothetical protein M3071_22670, partial [Actinomycetota bacterium]|nr:hypothetical protein [Actinomycetota bacterium]
PSHARSHRRAYPSRVHAQPGAKHGASQVAAAPMAQLSGSVRPAGSATGIAWMLGVAALVLAVGGMGGAVVARHRRRTSAHTS